SYTQMPIATIAPSRFEPQARRRAKFTDDEISELADSIKANGLIQPITVRPIDDDKKYEIVCGERRFLAVKKLKIDSIDVVIRNLSDAAALDVQITENLQRKDVDPIDEAFSFKYPF
ncbi:MAG: ParB/RepB/Spo0J family partition protein, partial [Pyrinomonadaceae bacterium]